jgi:signal transduction histidine kinase
MTYRIRSVPRKHMKPTTIYLVQLPDAAREISQAAARSVFPDAVFVTASTVAEAQLNPDGGRQLLVLADPDETDTGTAVQTLGRDEFPRWAVVVLGRASSDVVEAVPPEDWTQPLLARVFRAAVQQHELMRETLQLRGDLKTVARRVSHDQRTLLGCINTTCELLKELPADNSGSVKTLTGIIRDSLGELCLLIDRVNFVLKASSDAIAPAPVAMGAILDNALQHLEVEITSSGKPVSRAGAWPEAYGVGPWLEVVWWNLVNNALKHGAANVPVQVGWTAHGDFNKFWVSNRGPAVPESQRARLFQRFDQLHLQPTAGLGLSLVHRLVSLQGGECGYERTADGNSVFYFTLPSGKSRGVSRIATRAAARV